MNPSTRMVLEKFIWDFRREARKLEEEGSNISAGGWWSAAARLQAGLDEPVCDHLAGCVTCMAKADAKAASLHRACGDQIQFAERTGKAKVLGKLSDFIREQGL